jgi:hypothetical protein
MDLLKERWCTENGWAMVRVRQVDVYNDVLDWQGYLRKQIDARRTGTLLNVVTTPPYAPEYTSGAYAFARTMSTPQL